MDTRVLQLYIQLFIGIFNCVIPFVDVIAQDGGLHYSNALHRLGIGFMHINYFDKRHFFVSVVWTVVHDILLISVPGWHPIFWIPLLALILDSLTFILIFTPLIRKVKEYWF
tara:strand:- start:481 stop:816 length:336 start_codon:yes stop_codon:yes gene_type:complete